MYKGDLTKDEAFELMKKGHKVGREYFGSNEYVYLDNGIMLFEDGVSAYTEWWNEIEPTLSKAEDGKDWYLIS